MALKVIVLLISQKSDIDFYDSSPLEKTLALHNVIKLFKSVFNKDQNHYYYNIFFLKNVYINNTSMLIELAFLEELMLIK